MKPTDAVILTEYVQDCCPQQHIGEYTADAWHDLLHDLDLADCKLAVQVVANRQPFVSPSEIRAEVRRVRRERIARNPLPPPPPELADDPGRYLKAIAAGIERIAAGMDVQKAIAGPLPGDPPAEWQEAKQAVTPEPVDRQALALRLVEESRRERAAREAREIESGEATAS